MTAFWYFIGDMFQAIFGFVNHYMAGWFNKFLIVVGFIFFIGWIRYMIKNKEVTNWD